MSRLHVFDMDGTLLRGTTASLEVGRHLGCLPEVIRLEEAFAGGELDTAGFAGEIFRLWEGLTFSVAAKAFREAPWIGGLREVLGDIRMRGEHSLVVTMSPDFFADRLRAFGAEAVTASRFPALPFRTAPDPAGILSPSDKITAVDRFCASLGLAREECIAYGDSGSDIPLFRELRHTVAVNASAALRALAASSYDGEDLETAYRIGRDRMEDTAEEGVPPFCATEESSVEHKGAGL